ncbi:uncharacterized protein J8A68_005347 [[Candida] subhashii]|uniref:Transmembrane protein n=1 Tax=[Candida] subhashii TaxID=561895 RepID=A0A8J5UT75_9ASCO|nr:uncharacterized protein J8A68_005347 [[Candida] subhashii]KAG7661145.1 hypothetical protein J8A68_005347 [[Candida] subhashii]
MLVVLFLVEVKNNSTDRKTSNQTDKINSQTDRQKKNLIFTINLQLKRRPEKTTQGYARTGQHDIRYEKNRFGKMTKPNDQEFAVERRPNPKGWTPPKAPYNPYDPTDIRPPEGYPSEFQQPHAQPSGHSSIPKPATQYQRVNETMQRLNYLPRPMSDLYPGQYKVLRKVDTNQRLHRAAGFFGGILVAGAAIYGAFFYRWDGKENVFSGFYRMRLRFKEIASGLTEQEYDDLYHPRQRDYHLRPVKDAKYIPETLRKTEESKFALNRPGERHILEAQRIQQETEESMLKELEFHKQFAKEFEEDLNRQEQQQQQEEVQSTTTQRKKWFGIF